MKLPKNIIFSLLIWGLTSTATLAQKKIALGKPVVRIDKIEAIVNQEVILTSDMTRLQKNITKRYAQLGKKLPLDNILKQQILNKLITDRLQLQIANKIGLHINNAQVDQTLLEIAAKKGQTMLQMKAKMKLKGESYNAFSDNVRDELTMNELRQMEIRRRINITDQEVKQMIKFIHKQGNQKTKFHFVHIMLKKSEDNSPATAKKITNEANLIIKKLKAGSNANALAIRYSQGPKASKGGDWGWRTITDIPSFIASAFDDIKTKKGDIIGPFKSKIGTHIIKIIDKKGDDSVMTLQVKARHILIKPSIILSDDKVVAMLNTYRKQIIDGKKTFAELAEAHSQDPGSAVKGGNLGWADPNMYLPAFKEKATTMAIGKISRPFKTIEGWHILEILDRRKADTTQEATKRRAYNILVQQRFPAEVYAWLNEIRQQAYIKIINPKYIIKTE